MVFTRYDHRKLAFQHPRNHRKKHRSSFFVANEFSNEIRVADTLGGALGGGKFQVANVNSHARDEKKFIKRDKNSRKAILPAPGKNGNAFDPHISSSWADKEDHAPQLNNIAENLVTFHNNNGSNNDVEALSNVMMHLEEKQKKRQHEKISEEFADIKLKLNKILEEYGINGEEGSEENPTDEFDMRILTDPYFLTVADEEKNNSKTIIEDILEFYSTVCQEREQILNNVYDSLETENDVEAPQGVSTIKLFTPLGDETESPNNKLEDISSEITMTIDNISRKTQKLQRLYNKLLRISNESRHATVYTEDFKDGEQKVREMKIQKQVVGQFKKLQTTKTMRKEKLDTWKFAANEIVDLLKSVRQEGATDFEKLEKEFRKILDAFNAQGELLDDTQFRLQKQTENLKKSEAIKEKIKNDNLIFQDDIDRLRVQNRTAQMKIQQIQTQYQQKEIELKNYKEQAHQVNIMTPDINIEEEFASNIISNVDNKELYDKINSQQKTLVNYENEILDLNKINIELKVQLDQIKSSNKVELQQQVKENLVVESSSSNENNPVINKTECYDCKVHIIKNNKLIKKIKILQDDKNSKKKSLTVLQNTEPIQTEDDDSFEIKNINKQSEFEETDSVTDSVTNLFTDSVTNSITDLKTDGDYNSTKEVVKNNSPVSVTEEKDIIEEDNLSPSFVISSGITVNVERKKSFSDKAVQFDYSDATADGADEQQEDEGEKAKLTDSVDNEISSMAEKIFGFVNLAGKLTGIIHKRKTTEDKMLETNEKPETNVNATRPSTDVSNERDELPKLSKRKTTQDRHIDRHDGSRIKEHGVVNNTSDSKQVKVVSLVPPSMKTNRHNTPSGRNASQHTFPPSHSHHEHESMKRNWTESGFFDEGMNTNKKNNVMMWHERPNQDNGWPKLKYGKSHHVLRFLSRIAKTKCTLLSHQSDIIRKESNSPEEAIVNELSAFAEHAIDLLDVISFALKRIEIDHAEELLDETLAGRVKTPSLLTMNKPTWEQNSSVAENGSTHTARKVQFDAENVTFPGIHSAKHKDLTPANDEEQKLGKVAQKKRQRVLERHKKLVERLRASGVGMKQICTILGITKSPTDEEEEDDVEDNIPPALKKAQREQVRRMSLIGHAFNSTNATNQSMQPNHLTEMKQLRHRTTKSKYNSFGKAATSLMDESKTHQNRRSFAANAMKRSSFFPPIPIKTTGEAPMANFFETKALGSLR